MNQVVDKRWQLSLDSCGIEHSHNRYIKNFGLPYIDDCMKGLIKIVGIIDSQL